MFGNGKPSNGKPNESLSSNLNTVARGTEVSGEIKSEGIIRIDGVVKGTVTSKAKIAVGKTGQVIGDIFCEEADIEGKVEGSVNADQKITIRRNGNVTGDIQTDKLSVEAGALFNGTCQMGMSKAGSRPAPKAESKHEQSSKESAGQPTLQKEAI